MIPYKYFIYTSTFCEHSILCCHNFNNMHINSVSQLNWQLVGILSARQTQTNQYILFSLF